MGVSARLGAGFRVFTGVGALVMDSGQGLSGAPG